MAHEVQFCIPARQLGRSDIEFIVKRDKDLLGTLKVSNGSLVWFPKNTREGYKLSWAKFDEIMTSNAQSKEHR
jgi:hypothetical protein